MYGLNAGGGPGGQKQKGGGGHAGVFVGMFKQQSPGPNGGPCDSAVAGAAPLPEQVLNSPSRPLLDLLSLSDLTEAIIPA